MIIDLSAYWGISMFFLRLILAAVFFESGRRHLKDPEGRGKSIGLSKRTTIILGVVEVVCSVALVFGIYIQVAALALIIVMIGAIQKKAFVWKTGFWGKDSNGWHYELILLLINLTILLSAGATHVPLP